MWLRPCNASYFAAYSMQFPRLSDTVIILHTTWLDLHFLSWILDMAIHYRGGSRNFRHIQWSSNFTAIFDGNSKFLPSIDLEKLWAINQKIKMEGVSGNPRNPLKPPLHYLISDIYISVTHYPQLSVCRVCAVCSSCYFSFSCTYTHVLKVNINIPWTVYITYKMIE